MTDQKERARRGIKLAKGKTPHIASPEVVLDDATRQLVMFYHGQRDSLSQVTHAATSKDGISFNLYPGAISSSYVRSFVYRGRHYLIGTLGMMLRSDSLLGDYKPRDKPLFEVDLRHLAVWLDKKEEILRVFWPRVGDAPEHIMLSEVKLSEDWDDWDASAPVTVIKPEAD